MEKIIEDRYKRIKIFLKVFVWIKIRIFFQIDSKTHPICISKQFWFSELIITYINKMLKALESKNWESIYISKLFTTQ